MPRIYLPLLPLPVLAVVVAFSACSGSHGDEPALRVIPQASALTPAPRPGSPTVGAPPSPDGDDAPSAEEVQAFERPVAK
jgi:hypothetical protein